MSQPNKKPRWNHRARIRKVDDFLNALRVLDRTVVEVSMHIYKIPRRERAAVLAQHRRLHDSVRKRLPRVLYQTPDMK